MQPSFENHLWSQLYIMERFSCPQIVFTHHSHLIHPSPSRKGIYKCSVKGQDLRFRTPYPLPDSFLAKIIHDRCNINIIRTADSTCITARTFPDCVRFQCFIFHPERQAVHQLVRRHIHLICHRTADRTFGTLITQVWILFDFRFSPHLFRLAMVYSEKSMILLISLFTSIFLNS